MNLHLFGYPAQIVGTLQIGDVEIWLPLKVDVDSLTANGEITIKIDLDDVIRRIDRIHELKG